MKVAVTGGSGRIGSETVRQLRERGHEVLSLDIVPPADTSLPHKILDLRAPSAVRRAFDGCDAVCHLGEWPAAWVGPAEAYAHNSEVGTSAMAIAKQVGVGRFIYTSSCQVYGYWGLPKVPLAPAMLPFTEQSPLQPTNAYALAKVGNEAFAALMAADGTMPIAAFRFPMISRWPLQPWQISERHRSGKRWLDGLGTYLHVEDAATAYCAALERGWTGFEAFHFVAADLLTADNLKQLVLDQWPDFTWPAGLADDAHPISTNKAASLLGWAPKHSLRQPFLDALSKLAKTG